MWWLASVACLAAGAISAAAEAALRRGVEAARDADADAAIAHLEHAAQLEPSWALPRLKRANVLAVLHGDAQAAEKAYREAIELETTHDALYFFGQLQLKGGRFAEAAASFERALVLDPGSDAARAGWQHSVAGQRALAQSLQEENRIAEAQSALRVAAELEPTNAATLFNLGATCQHMGDSAEAASHFAAAAASPGAPAALVADAHFSEAVAHKELGALAEAEGAYRRALSAAPDDASSHRVHFNLGNLLRTAGRLDEAADQFEAAIALRPHDADSFFQLRKLAKVAHTSTCDEAQPLTRARRHGLPQSTFERLRTDILAHPWTRLANRLSASFRGTNGFVVRFNKEGISRFREHPHLQALVPWLEAAALPDATVFVMNVLVVPASPRRDAPDDEAAGDGDGATQLAVKAHLDITGAICSRDDSYIAHQVDVLYLDVPRGIVGGRLLVWEPGASEGSAPRKAIDPESNLWVSFRGDAKHGVERWQLPPGETAKEARVSLVLEQYLVPSRLLGQTTEFEVVGTAEV